MLRRDTSKIAKRQETVQKPNYQWRRVLVPAVDRPFSIRCLEVAYRLAQESGAVVQLGYLLEVPRALDLEALLPEKELTASESLRDAQQAALPYRVKVEPYVHRTRNVTDGILRLVAQEQIDLLILGGRPDGSRGLPSDLARELFNRAPCEVIVDYIAGEA